MGAGPTDCRMTAAFDISKTPLNWHAIPLYIPTDPWFARGRGAEDVQIGAPYHGVGIF